MPSFPQKENKYNDEVVYSEKKGSSSLPSIAIPIVR